MSEFEEVVKPVMKYLNDHHNPHCTIIITSTRAEVMEGIQVIRTTEYLHD